RRRRQEDQAGNQHRLNLSPEGRARRRTLIGRSGTRDQPLGFPPDDGRVPGWLRGLLNQDQPSTLTMKQETDMSLTTMSLDNTSHLGTRAPDELVPSRYA